MIKIVCLGKLKELYLVDFVSDYLTRIKKYHNLKIIELKDDNSLAKEKEAILKNINSKEYLIVMDKDGKNLSSLEFSKKLDETFINYGDITFIIGSSEGIHVDIKNKANLLLSFGNNTFPHGIFRAMLLEQIYRSFKILNNETYHK